MEDGGGGRRWRRLNRFQLRLAAVVAAALVFLLNFNLCLSLNSEGLALLRFREEVVRDPFDALANWNGDEVESDPCNWFGVECSDGKVVILNLRDLCLDGKLAPELGKLIHVKSIILRNNSFSGEIPSEIGALKELEVLDLGYNNFSGSFATDLTNNLSLSILLLDNNKFLDSTSPEVNELKMLSEFQVDETQLSSAAAHRSCHSKSGYWNSIQPGDEAKRRLLQVAQPPRRSRAAGRRTRPLLPPPPQSLSPALSPSSFQGSPLPSISLPPSSISSPSESPVGSPSESLAPSPSSPAPQMPPSPTPANPPMASEIPHYAPAPIRSPGLSPNISGGFGRNSKSKHQRVMMASWIVGGSIFLFIAAFTFIFFQRSKEVTIKPWATGLSGQLQKAFITGVPKLQRSELVTACEDFSNIIGTLSDGTVYKGTLSSGVEIAVTSTAVKSAGDWSKNLETQFRRKIDTLSKLNHKNFVNLIGFCEEENPFTRMMVFEYAPNGTLFEHLHIKEAEHLDWGMRLRIAMGMAYCLEYLHQLNPPIAHGTLQSSSIYLTEDYAAKISDFSFWNEATAAKMESASMELLETQSSDPVSNVYSFGVILFEMITGRFPYSVDLVPPVDWASEYLKLDKPVREMVDPTLNSFQENEAEKLFQVIQDCVHSDPNQRPSMKDVAARLKEITAMEPDGATPRVSPLWWAELEIMSESS